jgi:hypothetical protein
MSWRMIAAIGLLVLLSAGGFYGARLAGQADVAAAAMAKVICSCVFVDNRSLDSCRADDPPGFEQVGVEVDDAAKTATGRLLGFIARRATYSPQYGCTLEP